MGENKRVIELKTRELVKELNRDNPDKNKIKRLKESIKRQRLKSKSRH